jgi:RNA polymerase sigma factor (sigma-70 family)
MGKENYSDQEILDGIKRQDSEILLFIYKKNFRSVKHYIENNSGNEKDAEDIFQDVLITLFDKIRLNTLNLHCSFHTYLFSVLKFAWLRQLALKDQKRFSIEDCDDFSNEYLGLTDDLLKTERRNMFLQHFNEISQDCQKIIRLILKGYTITEITKVMGYQSEQHTKNRRFRCKKNLIERILKNPNYKELTNERTGENYSVPRW